MPGLKIERAISKRVAALHTFSASDTQLFINGVFKIRIFYICPFDGTGWTELAFCSCISGSGAWLEIPAAEIAVAAHRIGVNAFYGGMRQNTVDCAFFTLDTDIGIQLPNHLFRGRPGK
jgi:hypothetical protein